ncbi:MAG: carbohydrate porin [Gemmatimonadaceae bacterium]|nr:carbohydrate porin [Gemmatimonadaceae bacterium]
MSSSSPTPSPKSAGLALALVGVAVVALMATRAAVVKTPTLSAATRPAPAAAFATASAAPSAAPSAATSVAPTAPEPAASATVTTATTPVTAPPRAFAATPAASAPVATAPAATVPTLDAPQATESAVSTRAAAAVPAVIAVAPSLVDASAKATTAAWPPAGGVPTAGPGIALSQLRLPGLTTEFTDISDMSGGTSGMSAAHGARTHTIVNATLDLEQFAGWKGATLFAQHKMKQGANGSGAAGLMQHHSNIDADDFRAAGEIWLEQRLFNDVLRLKAGRLDFNTEFAGTDNGGSFLNASMGYTPAIAAAPTFPLPINAFNVIVSPREHSRFSLGAFDGRDGAPAMAGSSSRFYIGQFSQGWSRGDGRAFDGRVSLGSWRHTGMFSAADADADAEPTVRGTGGWYGTMDLTLWRGAASDSGADDAPSAAMFFQVGRGNPRISAVDVHQGLGLVTSGLVPHRQSDAIGFGVTHASWSGGRETIGEAFCQAPLGSHVTLVADLQRVNHFDSFGQRNGFIPNLRTIVKF